MAEISDDDVRETIELTGRGVAAYVQACRGRGQAVRVDAIAQRYREGMRGLLDKLGARGVDAAQILAERDRANQEKTRADRLAADNVALALALSERTQERDALKAENASLKARGP